MYTRSKASIDPLAFGVWGAILGGLIAILIGLRQPILLMFGESANASVTHISRATETRSDGTRRRTLIVYYEFQDTAGKTYSGMQNQLFSTSAPQRGDRLPVRYLPAFPYLNAPDTDSAFIGSIIFLVAGICMLGFSFLLSDSPSKKKDALD